MPQYHISPGVPFNILDRDIRPAGTISQTVAAPIRGFKNLAYLIEFSNPGAIVDADIRLDCSLDGKFWSVAANGTELPNAQFFGMATEVAANGNICGARFFRVVKAAYDDGGTGGSVTATIHLTLL